MSICLPLYGWCNVVLYFQNLNLTLYIICVCITHLLHPPPPPPAPSSVKLQPDREARPLNVSEGDVETIGSSFVGDEEGTSMPPTAESASKQKDPFVCNCT